MSVSKGFTLTELLIAVAIVAIVSSVAYPSYIQYVQEGHRAQVQQQMMQSAAVLERIYSRNGGYPDTSEFNALPDSKYYQLAYIPAGKPSGAVGNFRNMRFRVTATPKAGEIQASDRCGVLSINHRGELTGAEDDCW